MHHKIMNLPCIVQDEPTNIAPSFLEILIKLTGTE